MYLSFSQLLKGVLVGSLQIKVKVTEWEQKVVTWIYCFQYEVDKIVYGFPYFKGSIIFSIQGTTKKSSPLVLER